MLNAGDKNNPQEKTILVIGLRVFNTINTKRKQALI